MIPFPRADIKDGPRTRVIPPSLILRHLGGQHYLYRVPYLNRSAWRALGYPLYVMLESNQAHGTIAIVPTTKENPFAHRVRQVGKRGGADIGGHALGASMELLGLKGNRRYWVRQNGAGQWAIAYGEKEVGRQWVPRSAARASAAS